MKRITGLGYLATVTFVAAAMSFVSSPASAGKGYGRDNNQGHANSHAEGGHSSNGALASARGALNAAHASGEAFSNANSNSRVGMLAEYMLAMTVYQTLYDELSEEEQTDYDAALAVLADPEATQEQKDDAQATIDAIGTNLVSQGIAAGGELEDAANKGELIDDDLVHSVNTLLDGKDGFTHNIAIHNSENLVAGDIDE